MIEHEKETYWSRFAHTFNEDQVYIVGNTAQVVLNRLSEERDLGGVIEFGCGAGFNTKVIAKNAKHVLATDLSDEMLEVAEEKLKGMPNITIQKANCKKTSFPSGRFDTVFMGNLLHIIKDPQQAVHESYRILKDGGLLLVVDYTGYGMKRFEMMKMGIRFFKKWGMPHRHGKALSPDELKSLVENAGFKVEEVQLIGDKTKALYLRGRKG